jgi:hypothetical protein
MTSPNAFAPLLDIAAIADAIWQGDSITPLNQRSSGFPMQIEEFSSGRLRDKSRQTGVFSHKKWGLVSIDRP